MGEIILLTVFLFCLFIIGVLCVALINRCSAKKATKICKKFITDIFMEIFTGDTQLQYFPVLVGYDGTRIVPPFVDSEFKKISLNFDVCYFTQVTYTSNGNIVVYHFSIQKKADSLPDEQLEELLQKQAEEVLSKTMHDYDCYVPVEPLTAVKLRTNDFLVAYARTQEGITKLDEVKKQAKRRYRKESRESNEFTTDWRKL